MLKRFPIESKGRRKKLQEVCKFSSLFVRLIKIAMGKGFDNIDGRFISSEFLSMSGRVLFLITSSHFSFGLIWSALAFFDVVSSLFFISKICVCCANHDLSLLCCMILILVNFTYSPESFSGRFYFFQKCVQVPHYILVHHACMMYMYVFVHINDLGSKTLSNLGVSYIVLSIC